MSKICKSFLIVNLMAVAAYIDRLEVPANGTINLLPWSSRIAVFGFLFGSSAVMTLSTGFMTLGKRG